MSKRFRVEIEGSEEIARKLAELSDTMAGGELAVATRLGAEVVAEEAANRVPRKSGNLARSMSTQVTKATRTRATVLAGPTKDGYYGRFLEFGTSRQAARPFLRPAFDEKKDEVVRVVGDYLRGRLGVGRG